MNKRVVGVLVMLLGALMLVCALLMMAENRREETQAGEEAASALTMIRRELAQERGALLLPTDAQEEKEEETTPVPTTVQPTPLPTIAPLEGEMPTMQINGQSYIGYIELPTLGISLPVMEEWSYPKLRVAPCRYSGSAYDDSLVILAHNYARHFGNIQSLAIGDPAQFIDADGNIFQYVVAKHETLGRRDVKEMTDSEYDLTLFTCTYGGRSRITVRLKRVDGFGM